MKSTSVPRGGTTKKKVPTAAIDDDNNNNSNNNNNNLGNHLSADSSNSSDENYDDVRIEHFETTFEKTMAPPKRARILGGGGCNNTRKQRGTFGVGMKHKSSLFSSTNKVITPLIRKQPPDGTLNSATAALLQQQQENLAFRHLNSMGGLGAAIEGNDDDDDETNLFEMLNSIPSDLRPSHHHSTHKPAAHQRSESAVPTFLSSRSPFRLVRSSTTHESQPPRPKLLRRLQRSHSMALNHNVDDTTPDFWKSDHTVDPDHGGLDAIERNMIHGPPKARKLIRAQRRHSWIPHSDMIRSTSVTTTSSGSISSNNLLQGSMGSFPDVIDELDVSENNRSKPKMFSSLSQINVNNMSPEPRSETSTSTGCRKRGVSTSSVSDIDEYIQLSGGSLSSKRRNHSTEQLLRIFSPPPGQQMPLAPCLGYNDDFDNSDFATSFGRHHSVATVTHQRNQKEIVPDRNGRMGRLDHTENMDQDTSIEDVQSEKDSSPDNSFEAVDDDPTIPRTMPAANSVVEESFDTKVERVLETMPSIDDLIYLINELKDEERRSRRVIVGAGDMWKIAPPLQQWTSHRRTTFIHWAKVSLGFIVRSAGMGYMFVQIHKKRGLQVVELLEHAKIKYLASNPHHSNMTHQTSDQQENPIVLFTNRATNLAPTTYKVQADSTSEPTVHLLYVFNINWTVDTRNTRFSLLYPFDLSLLRMANREIADDTEKLTDKLSSLSMTSKSDNSSLEAGNPQNRTVTLPMTSDENFALQNLDNYKYERLPIDQLGVGSKSSRPSFESHTHSGELSQHLLGHSPRLNAGRPPKGTMISYRCSIDGADNGGNTRHGRTSNADNLCFVTTPLMAKDRGWGSRPIGGQDWGTSATCENSTLDELIVRFESSLAMNGVMTTCGDHLIPLVSLSQLDFDLEADDKMSYNETDVNSVKFHEQKNADRLYKKRVSNYNKMKRMSLFASAVNSQVGLKAQRQSIGIDTIEENNGISDAAELTGQNEKVVTTILSFLNESELMTKAFPVCKVWSDYATVTHTNLLVASIQSENVPVVPGSVCARRQEPILEVSWNVLHRRFPWGCFLAEGGAKKVHKVYNSAVNAEEALSVMDTYSIDNVQIVANELAVSAMVSSLVRRGVCPNFIAMHKVFTCAYAPPESHWGSDINKFPRGLKYDRNTEICTPNKPTRCNPGRYQYIQMELANEGDAEELIKRQPNESFPTDLARSIFFQVSYALFAASEKFSIKHYDVKLLNVFVQNTNSVGDLVLRYGLGSHIFALKMPPKASYIAKVADFGTSNMVPSTSGLPVTISHFTTLENTPPDYLILGDSARQGHSHDNFGLGLIMLHLFTGSRPYEEILEDVVCPPNLKKRLQNIWENERMSGYSVIRSVIFDGVDVDECGNVEGTPDDTLYDTLYRYLVLFGIPKQKSPEKNGRIVWKAITDSLQGTSSSTKNAIVPKHVGRKKANTDITAYRRDCKKFSIRTGSNKNIARARHALTVMEGGLELLFGLCNFDPTIRATAMDVLNSKFMESLREQPGWTRQHYDSSADVRSFMSFSTTNAE